MPQRETYAIRGKRVPFLSDQNISDVADAVANLYKINRKTAGCLGMFMEDVQQPIKGLDRFAIHIDVVDVPKPLSRLVRASCDPRTGTITLPEKLYIRIADGDVKSAHTLFHEIGHIFLMHDPALHVEPESPPCKNEDSEYQADKFADRIMQKIAGKNWRDAKKVRQLELF